MTLFKNDKKRSLIGKNALLICGAMLGLVIFIIVIFAVISSPFDKAFDLVGTKGTTQFLVLDTSLNLSNQRIADLLGTHYSGKEVVAAWVFDNETAPERWMELWDDLSQLSEQQWDYESSNIYPHFVAAYDKNNNTGLNEVKFFSLNSERTVIQTIKN